MPLSDIKEKYTKKNLSRGPAVDVKNRMKSIYGAGHEPHTDYFYGFLGLIYDGINTIDELKSKMKVFFIASTHQLVVGDEDVEEYIQFALVKNLIKIDPDERIKLTDEGKELAEYCFHINLHTTYWMRKIFNEKTVMIFSTIFLIILSTLKIFTGLALSSQGMLNEGFENLTDLIKIAIITILAFKLKKDRLASIIIVLLMMFTGASLIWSSADALLNPSPITPTIEAYLICFLSIALNGILLFVKSLVGRTSNNLSLLSDSKDSALNIKISAGVIIGLTFSIFDYYFVDALVGIIIGILVFKEGIEIITELVKKEEDFDITAIKVAADSIYDNSLTGYILASIRRERISKEHLIDNFEAGLEYGRNYYQGFADFFYNDLGSKIAEKHINTLIKGNFLEESNDVLLLTPTGMRYFYKAKAKDYRSRAKSIYDGMNLNIRRGPLYCLLIIAVITLLIIFGNDINTWLNSL